MNANRILCLSGSLRGVSYNTALIKALPSLAPDNMEMVVFPTLGTLPLFNPDHEEEDIASVKALKTEIKLADGMIIASPEYAHGISGVLKNALDWLVSSEHFYGMPTVLFNAAPRARHAQAALREVLNTMSAEIIEEASITVPLLSSNLDTNGIINHSELSARIRNALVLFHEKIEAIKKAYDS